MTLKDFSKIFFAVLILHLVTIYKQDSGILHQISKPLLLFSLLVFFWQHPMRKNLSGAGLVAAALFFSLAGDVFLLYSGMQWSFLAGMAAFGLTHFLMLLFYWQRVNAQIKPLSIIPLLLGIGAFLILWQYLVLPLNMEVPVYIYTALIVMHFAAAFNAALQKTITWWPVLGIALFLVSDLLLALNHFGSFSMPTALAVMATYALGQFAIVAGLLHK